MIITGSALFVEPDKSEKVKQGLAGFPEITFHCESQSSLEMVVTIEAEGTRDLDRICSELKSRMPEIVDIAHLYVNFEDEVERISGCFSRVDDREKPTYWE